MSKVGTMGVGTADVAEAPADDDELLDDDRAPPPPLVRLPTETTDAVRADERSDPKVVDDDNRFSSHSAI
jgi:hypothetical protein